jgi:hypothetical protein
VTNRNHIYALSISAGMVGALTLANWGHDYCAFNCPAGRYEFIKEVADYLLIPFPNSLEILAGAIFDFGYVRYVAIFIIAYGFWYAFLGRVRSRKNRWIAFAAYTGASLVVYCAFAYTFLASRFMQP